MSYFWNFLDVESVEAAWSSLPVTLFVPALMRVLLPIVAPSRTQLLHLPTS
jgi:hypothetical protein